MKTDIGFVARYLASNYAELQNVIRMADTKANILLALIGVILSLFFSSFISKNPIPMWQVIIILTLFFISGALALSTLYPRFSKKSGKFSLIYYKDAVDVKSKDFIKDIIKNNNQEKLMEDYINNIKAISAIINKKFQRLRLAYILFGLAVVVKVTFELYTWFL